MLVRIVIVGGGIVGCALARALMRRDIEPMVLERGQAGSFVPRPFMLPYHGFDLLEDIGMLGRVRGCGWDIPPIAPDGRPVAISAAFGRVLGAIAESVKIAYEHEVVSLVRRAGHVVGLRVRHGREVRDVPADLVVACDGVRSPVRDMAGIRADIRLAEAAHLSFLSPAVVDRPFALHYQSDGRQVGLLGWPEGSAGWWDVERVGRDAALAPGLDAFRRAFTRLLPAAEPAVAALTSVEQLVYREITEVRCPEWWTPGVVVIGDAARFLGPEAGIGAGMGLGDALALAQAIATTGDPDSACREYVRWREPAVRPYEAVGADGARLARDGEKPPEERWPPPA
jgi:2-polyprenyl-6-methoxyphenol hydroxylase-like FAD-dependent oxidoreductase